MTDLSRRLTLASDLDELESRLRVTANLWLEGIEREQTALERRKRERPEIPTPFVTGARLSQSDSALFKGRRDLVRLIDHEFTRDRRTPLLLCGQRRMGKSSLLQMLPIQLGTATQVVVVDFQGLSGKSERRSPHLLVARAIRDALRDLDPAAPPEAEAWGPTLEWLQSLDAVLRSRERRVLVAIDEVERWQDAIADHWGHTDFLDFLRATGDALLRIRTLLVSAYPLPRLGPHWVDRLISVQTHRISYLATEEAEDLACRPMPDFPDIYPAGGVARIIDQTGGQPYLIQLVCDELVRDLNGQQRLRADSEDVERALDAAVAKTSLFSELWERHTTADERAWLRRLAQGPQTVSAPDAALRELTLGDYVIRDGDTHRIAVPLFQSWIEANQDRS